VLKAKSVANKPSRRAKKPVVSNPSNPRKSV